MRVFQNFGLYPSYQARLAGLTRNCGSFHDYIATILGDRFGGCHLLEPVLRRDEGAFFTCGDDAVLQGMWAREHSMGDRVSLDDILLAQIEEHRTEVFYNLDPMRFGSAFVARLPGCVRKSIAWRAAPSPGADFSGFSLVVCNFPGILEGYRRRGWKCAYFAPAHDPEMNHYAARRERPIDVLFVGGYTRHHRRRAELLEAMAGLSGSLKVEMCLDSSRLTRLSETWPLSLLPLRAWQRPESIREVAAGPRFGRDLYDKLASAKIIFNGAIDMAGEDRGNMRCFEAMGTGGVLLTDAGRYPGGMVDGLTMVTYSGPQQAVSLATDLSVDASRLSCIADAAFQMISTDYSKEVQWQKFQQLAE